MPGFDDLFKELTEVADIATETRKALTPASINMNPSGIDWTKEDAKIVTTSGVVHSAKEEKDLSKNYFVFNLGTHVLFDIVDCGDYLSVKPYKHLCTSVAHYNTLVKSGKPLVAIDSAGDVKDCVYPDIQLRIYKDHSYVFLFRYDHEGVSRYFCENPKSYTSSSSRYPGPINIAYFDFDKYLDEHLNDPYQYIEIYNESDIQKYAHRDNHNCQGFLGYFGVAGSKTPRCFRDLYNRESSHNHFVLDESHSNLFNDFFDFEHEKDSDSWVEFDKKYDYANETGTYWIRRDVSKGITGIFTLGKFLCCNGGSVALEKSRAERADTVWPTLHWPAGELNSCWERRGDQIIVTVGNETGKRSAFLYNTATNIRYVLSETSVYVSCGKRETRIKTQIPSLRNCIGNLFYILNSAKSKPEFYDGVSLKDLFKHSNVEWILDNLSSIDDEFWYNNNIHKYSKEISTDKITIMAVDILATSGEPVLEQLLKNKLFHLYFLILTDKHNAQYGFDADKTKGDIASESQAVFGFHSKQKSLKKMFGMNIEQLRLLDAAIKYDSKKSKLEVPHVYDAEKILGLESLNQVDLKTFQLIIDSGTFSYYSSKYGVWNHLHSYEHVKTLMNPMSVKQKIEFVNKYNDADNYNAWEQYDDYLQMRTQMRDFQKRHPGETIYSDKWYPDRPGCAKKFIMYRKGMSIQVSPWSSWTCDTSMQFINAIERAYDKNYTIVYTDEENTSVLGVVLDLNLQGNIKFLHKELTTWFNIYEDEAISAKFKDAVKKLRKFEWTDEELGLAMVAPREASEVQKEGVVLDHCVASFIEPISNGEENVLFIRRTDMLDEPYFTVAVDNKGKIEQIHCHANGGLLKADQEKAYKDSGRAVYAKYFDIVKFVKRWATAMGSLIDSRSVRDTYGCPELEKGRRK